MAFQVSTLYDPGTAKVLEDKFIVRPPFFGVLDGVSEIYDPAAGPRLFEGKSGGQRVVEIVDEVFSLAKEDDELEAVVKRANTAIREFFESQNIPINRLDLLSGATFAFAKVIGEKVNIIHGGDCFAVWGKIDGEVGATPNQNFLDEEEKSGILNEIIKKHNGNRDSAWKEYMPFAVRFRERINKIGEPHSVGLSGQPEGEDLFYKNILPRKELKTLLLFTDGMIEFEESRNPVDMAKIILDTYHHERLEGMLARIRDIESKRTHTTHIAHAEATAIAVEF